MRKTFVKLLSAFLALVLILAVLPMAVFASETAPAAGHVHEYSVTDASYVIPSDYNATGHAFIERHLHTCACGEKFYETHEKEYRSHVFFSNDARFAYTTIGDDGETLYVYYFDCAQCNYTAVKMFTAPLT